MTSLRSLLLALAGGIALAAGDAREEIAFRPESGASVAKTFIVTGEYELDELSLIVSGQDVGGMLPPIEMSMRNVTRIEVTDVYRSFEDGRLLELVRTFEGLSESVEMLVSPAEAEIPEMESASELEGRTVVFRWNPDAEEYERSFESGDDDAELLDDLDVDMDYRVFLPAGEVEVGGTWTVPLASLAVLMLPGGDLDFRPADAGLDEGAFDKFEELFDGFGERIAEQLDGECTCTYKGTREDDGRQLAEIAIDLGIATTLDLTEVLDEAIRTALEDNDAGEMVRFTIGGADLDLDFEGEGTLLWDLAAGRAHAFHLSGDATIGIDLVVGVEAQGESQDVDAALEFSGTMTHELVTGG